MWLKVKFRESKGFYGNSKNISAKNNFTPANSDESITSQKQIL